MSQIKLAFKLPAMVVAIALATGASLALAAYFVGDAIVSQQAQQRLTAASANAQATLDSYLQSVADDLTLFAGRSEISAAIDMFSGDMRSLRGAGRSNGNSPERLYHAESQPGRRACAARFQR
jgi:methyl-accepting chemotaxis protein